MRVLVLGLALIFCGCKGKEDGNSERIQPSELSQKRLGSMRAYVFTEKEVYIINLEDDTFNKISIGSKIHDAFMAQDTIWVAANSLFRISEGEVIEEIELPSDYEKIIKDGAHFFVLTNDGILQLPDQRKFTIPSEAIKFDVQFGKIWGMDEESFSIYRVGDFKELHRIPLEKGLDFALSPYGIRVYIATHARLNIFDPQTANYIADIPIETDEQVLLKVVGDKIYCLTESILYKIDRTTNRIENQLKIDGGNELFLSRSGKYGAVLRDSIISFFDSEVHKIIKNIKLKVVDITTTIGDSRIYCLTQEELIAITPDKFQAISRLKLIGGKRIIIK